VCIWTRAADKDRMCVKGKDVCEKYVIIGIVYFMSMLYGYMYKFSIFRQ
jgi:hypothetical protein